MTIKRHVMNTHVHRESYCIYIIKFFRTLESKFDIKTQIISTKEINNKTHDNMAFGHVSPSLPCRDFSESVCFETKNVCIIFIVTSRAFWNVSIGSE